MELTEIRIKLIRDKADKLRAFASITLDQTLVIRDLKIIEGGNGLFVAMPSRKLCDRCPACGGKNHLRSRFCNDCGARLRDYRGRMDERGRPRLYADISHPINQDARDYVQGRGDPRLQAGARSLEAGRVRRHDLRRPRLRVLRPDRSGTSDAVESPAWKTGFSPGSTSPSSGSGRSGPPWRAPSSARDPARRCACSRGGPVSRWSWRTRSPGSSRPRAAGRRPCTTSPSPRGTPSS